MIKALLEHDGKLDVNGIAKALSFYDLSQIEYYERVTHNMVGKVLRNHKVVKRDKNLYELNEYEVLSENEIKQIVDACEQKIDEYIEKRGNAIWAHRSKTRQAVSGTIRYEVLKRAKYRCELCGISAEEKALEVDHIVPKNLGGEDSINNYQALCYTCNAQKRDLDDTDFRDLSQLYDNRDHDCIFCNLSNHKLLYENNLSVAFYDSYPVSNFHMLVIPKRHANDYFELFQPEINSINEIIFKAKSELSKKDTSIKGFNIGVNNGIVAGQTVHHCHIHMIPRRDKDVSDPTGGVRNVFPGKGNYRK
jgi:ATP adenylyltransferase